MASRYRENAVILNVGAGITTLLVKHLELGYCNIIANDLSDIALESLKSTFTKPIIID
jgi:hypothetical protein